MFVIKSNINYGYWSNIDGWVYDVESATKFTEDEIVKTDHKLVPDEVYLPAEQATDFNPDNDPYI